MPIQFTCPHCGAQTEVSDEFAGQSGPCARCGKPITVPRPDVPQAYAAPARKSTSTLVVLIIVAACSIPVLLACAGILVALLLPAVQAAREAARRAACQNNLRRIGVAMQAYHEEHGTFPPAYIADENGRPMHSWRVLILPYLDLQALYDQYDLEEPWDGPNNILLADLMLEAYRCPSDVSTVGQFDTSYAMIVGPGTISDGPTGTKSSEIRDGPSNTIMVVEVAGAGIHWMEPRDLNAKEISFGVNEDLGDGIQSDHAGVANVLFCDGSVRSLSNSAEPKTVQATCTIAGGEVVSLSDLER
jgi:prepilin-type processing-associated H-X9-DG protein